MPGFREMMSNVDWVVVPSRWWEGSPLVIQDAFLYGRPVICGDIGAMAEKVAHEVNGLHFAVADPWSLADAVCRAVTTPGSGMSCGTASRPSTAWTSTWRA